MAAETGQEKIMAKMEPTEVNRRGFIKAAAVTAVAAAATGVGAATLSQAGRPAATTITTAPAATPGLVVPPIPAANPQAAAFSQLAAAQAENMRLQAALDAANRQLAAYQQHDANATAANEAIQLELASANERASLLAGLVALYEQLEEVELDGMLASGVTAVTESITGLLDEIPGLETSLETGRLALAEVEAHLPVLENGRSWLALHLGKLELFYQQIEALLHEAVEAAGPFLAMINDWFAGVKKWLPFGLGQKAATIMQSITVLLIETPGTVSGLNSNIAQPLDVWLARDDQNDYQLTGRLIKPLRDDVMARTNETFVKARQIDATFTAQLKEPAATAVANKQSIRELIATYRQEHQL